MITGTGVMLKVDFYGGSENGMTRMPGERIDAIE